MFPNKSEENNNTLDSSQQIPSKNDDKPNSIQIGGNYYSMYNNDNSSNKQQVEMDPSVFDKLLEDEKTTNHKEAWNKLDTSIKIKKLQSYADDYGIKNSLPDEDIKSLKNFFATSIRNNKLKKNKDIVYQKDTGIVTDVPGLFYSKLNKKYTIKNLDTKHVSTMKSYTPIRNSKKNKLKKSE